MQVSIRKNNIKLCKPFKYFLSTLDFLPYAEITLKTNDNITGKGEIACALDINGESSDSTKNLSPFIQNILKNAKIESKQEIVRLMNKINLYLSFNTGLKCGIEQALFQILTQRQNKTLAEIIGAKKKKIKIQYTIPYLKNFQEYKNCFKKIAATKPDFVKFKIGHNLKLEIAAIKKLRKQNQKINITVDANQSFNNAKNALIFLNTIKKTKLAWAEQLVEKNDFASWEKLKKKSPTPLMADESVQTTKDVLLFLQNGWTNVINLKLAKCGGIIEARKILKIAKKYKTPVMLGSMLHGELGLKYNLAFALSEDFITHAFYNYFLLKNHKEKPLINKNDLTTTKEVLC